MVFKNEMGDIIEKTKILDGRSINHFPIVMGVKEGCYCWLHKQIGILFKRLKYYYCVSSNSYGSDYDCNAV